MRAEAVTDPAQDPDWDGTEFFAEPFDTVAPYFDEDGDDVCGSREDGAEDGYRCTLPAGHEGDHTAHGPDGSVIIGWSKEG